MPDVLALTSPPRRGPACRSRATPRSAPAGPRSVRRSPPAGRRTGAAHPGAGSGPPWGRSLLPGGHPRPAGAAEEQRLRVAGEQEHGVREEDEEDDGIPAMGLWRLAADEVGPAHARDAVVFLVLFPYAVFLFAGYSEALFLGCTCWAWVAARQQRWAVGAVLAAGAAATRVLGIPLAVALAVEYGVSRWRAGHRTPGWRSLWLVLPAVPVLIFVGYLHARTGHWDTYARAMAGGWHRTLAAPWTGIRANWRFGSDPGQPSAYLWFWRAELAAVAVGVAPTAVLARGRRWGEASYVAGSTLLMSCSSYLASGVRAVLVWFPLYLALARATRRYPQIRWVYCWVCAGAAGLHRTSAEPAVDRGLYLCPDVGRYGVHRVRLRRLLPSDRRLAHRRIGANRTAAGRLGDGAVDPRPRRPGPGGCRAPQRRGQPVHVDQVHPAVVRRRRARLDRDRRGQLRQRRGGELDRALQGRMHQAGRALARRRRPRTRHAQLGALVQPEPAPQQPAERPTHRVRDRVLPSDQRPTAAAAGRTQPPLISGRFSVQWPVLVTPIPAVKSRYSRPWMSVSTAPRPVATGTAVACLRIGDSVAGIEAPLPRACDGAA